MADVLRGCGVVWGAAGSTGTGVVWSASTGEMQSRDLGREATSSELRNADGDVVGLSFSDLKKTFTASVIPSHATSKATAKTNMDAMIPAAGTIVTVTDSASTVTAAANGGKYLLDAARIRYTNNGFAIVEFDLTQYDANDVAVAVT